MILAKAAGCVSWIAQSVMNKAVPTPEMRLCTASQRSMSSVPSRSSAVTRCSNVIAFPSLLGLDACSVARAEGGVYPPSVPVAMEKAA